MSDAPPSSRGAWRRIARWIPAALLAFLLAIGWAALFSGGMSGVVAWILLLSLSPLLGAVALLGVGLYALVKRRFSPPIAATLGLALVALWPGAWSLGALQIPYPAARATTVPAASVRLPSDLPLRVVWGGDRIAVNQHAFTPDQRFAFDLVIEPAFLGASRLEEYGCWGTRVVAPASGRVALATDGLPDAPPGQLTADYKTPFGNVVAIRLDTGTYLIVAHLQDGSVAVKTGDEVREGDLIGRCGNSGNTSEPHIHIHHQRQDPAVVPVNFAEGLPLSFRDHDGPPVPEGGMTTEGERVVLQGPTVTHRGSAP